MGKISNLRKVILSGETAFAIFLIGAVFKESLPFQFIDLTALFLIISMLIFLKRLYFKPEIKKHTMIPIIWYSLVILLFLVSFIFSDSSIYGFDKLLRFMFITGWAFLGSLLIIRDRESLKRFFNSFIMITVICALFILTSNNRTAAGFIGLGGDNYLGSARIFGMGSVMLLAYYLYGDFSRKLKMIVLISLLTCLIALASTGARMPMITTVLVLLFLTMKTIKFEKGKLVLRKGTTKLVGLITVIVIGIIAFKDAPIFQTTIRRLEVLIRDSGGGSSASERLSLYNSAIEMFKENPFFGVGLGGFGINYSGVDQRYYPHNIFLEFLAETGIIGFLLFMAVFLISTRMVLKSFSETDHLTLAISSTYIYMMINVMVSGDFNDNRTFFTFLALTLIIPSYKKEDNVVVKPEEKKGRIKRYKIVW